MAGKRSTKASYAVAQLKTRSQNSSYSLVTTSDALFLLIQMNGSEPPTKLCSPLELDEFVKFVNNYQKEPDKKISKLDREFEAKLKKTSSTTN